MTLFLFCLLLGVIFTVAALSSGPPCQHPEWADLGDGDAVCEVCSEVFQMEGS